MTFRALDDFPLAWRWTSPEQHLLAPDVLADIRPLTVTAANDAAHEAESRCAEAPISQFAETWSAEWDDPASIRDRLSALFIRPDERVLVSWSPDLTVETSWRTFVRYWDAFCYPSSDDVTIWNPAQTWAVCYRHFRVMQVRYPESAI